MPNSAENSGGVAATHQLPSPSPDAEQNLSTFRVLDVAISEVGEHLASRTSSNAALSSDPSSSSPSSSSPNVPPSYNRVVQLSDRNRAESVGSLYSRVRGHHHHQGLVREASSVSMYKLCLGTRHSLASMASSSSSSCCSSYADSERHLHRCAHRPKNSKTAAFIVASSIYGQLLVVVCLAFFTAEITTTKIPLLYFECFYLYLYAVSLLFLFYVYVYLLHDLPSELRNKDGSLKKKVKISETERSHGSIFLRIGAIGFGLGTMIYNGLEFGSYFEIPYNSPCYSVLLGVNPVLQATFTFAQMYFIFTYSRLMINKFKLLARLGLMHLVGTNICVWIRTLGKETLQELKASSEHGAFLEELILPLRTSMKAGHGANRTSAAAALGHAGSLLASNASNPCQKEDIMSSILSNVSPYLYPFIVEYSLIGAAFLYVMWSNIGRRYSSTASGGATNGGTSIVGDTNSSVTSPTSPSGFTIDNMSTSSGDSSNISSHALYSCLGSSKGLFTGFLFLVVSITSLIIFFVLVHHPNYKILATAISELSHSILLMFCCIATLAAYIKIRKLKFQPGLHETADGGLRDLLLKIAAFGLYIYSLFGVIAGALQMDSLQHAAVLLTSTLTIVQITLQSLFISDVVCRRRVSAKEPGRQLITFLLITNLTLWIIYTFEMQKVEATPVQLKTYGFTTWALIVRFTLPLSIFYRFHSAITFAEVWKNSYK